MGSNFVQEWQRCYPQQSLPPAVGAGFATAPLTGLANVLLGAAFVVTGRVTAWPSALLPLKSFPENYRIILRGIYGLTCTVSGGDLRHATMSYLPFAKCLSDAESSLMRVQRKLSHATQAFEREASQEPEFLDDPFVENWMQRVEQETIQTQQKIIMMRLRLLHLRRTRTRTAINQKWAASIPAPSPAAASSSSSASSSSASSSSAAKPKTVPKMPIPVSKIPKPVAKPTPPAKKAAVKVAKLAPMPMPMPVPEPKRKRPRMEEPDEPDFEDFGDEEEPQEEEDDEFDTQAQSANIVERRYM